MSESREFTTLRRRIRNPWRLNRPANKPIGGRIFSLYRCENAGVAELVDARVLGARSLRSNGSSPFTRTISCKILPSARTDQGFRAELWAFLLSRMSAKRLCAVSLSKSNLRAIREDRLFTRASISIILLQEMESCRFHTCGMNVYKPADGSENFLDLEVTASDIPCAFDPSSLDSSGRRVLAGYANYCAVLGCVIIAWIDGSHREACKRNQSNRRRWKTVERYTFRLQNGETPPPPVFASPAIAGITFFRMVDGARRIMAAAEAHVPSLSCVVLIPKSENQNRKINYCTAV